MQDLKHLFPVSANYTYLNTASCGLLSTPLVDWRHQYDLQLLAGGSMFRDLHKPHIKEIREGVARFFSAEVDEVALLPNFSFGMNVLLDGMPNGKKVLLLRGDYPSVNWPFEQRDFNVCYAEITEDLEVNILEAMKKYHPDILALSVVQYISGIKIDLDFLKDLKSQFPHLIIMGDGTQYLGTEVFNFSESGFDVIGGSCYKWMLSGYGNALFMVKRAVQEKIRPETIGFNSADAVFSRRNSIEFVGHLEPGHQDALNYGSLGESIKWMEALGKEKIQGHLQSLSEQAKKEFTALNMLDIVVVNRNRHSTIFNLRGDDALFQKLKENNVICSLRGKGIRVSFHMYNTTSDLEKLLQLLRE